MLLTYALRPLLGATGWEKNRREPRFLSFVSHLQAVTDRWLQALFCLSARCISLLPSAQSAGMTSRTSSLRWRSRILASFSWVQYGNHNGQTTAVHHGP
jgi:hypothetical protein